MGLILVFDRVRMNLPSLSLRYHKFKILYFEIWETVIFEPVREKTNILGSDQARHKPACTVTEAG